MALLKANTGIGTTNPTSALHVIGDGLVAGVVTATSFSGNASSATYASIAGIATYATNSGISTNVIGGIASVTQLNVSSGVSTLGVTTTTNLTAQQLNVSGLSTFSGITTSTSTLFVNQLSVSGFSTFAGIATVTGTTLFAKQVNVSGVVTASSFSGNASSANYATTAGVSTSVIGGIASVTQLSVSGGISTLGVTSATDLTAQQLNVSGVSTFAGITTVTGTTLFSKQVNVSGVVTASSFSGNASSATYATNAGVATYATSSGIATYATTAGVATALQNARTFEITGDIVASPISFDGTGNVSLAATIQPNSVALGSDTTGDYVANITGTSNQITVTSGTGEGSTPTLSIPSQFTAPQDVTVTRDLQVNRNLNVTGNITIGGTSATIFSQSLNIFDPDIVLGYRTDALGNDVSNDNTANHGGVAVASTEGSPLVQLFIAGIETNPATYKKIMWFKEGTFSGLGTDAWLSNYAVGIGSTQFPTGTRLAAGNVQFTQNDLAVVRNINSSGVVTASSFSGNASSATYANIAGIATYATSTGIATYATTAGVSTSVIGGIGSITQLGVTGISTLGVTSTTNLTAQQLNVSGTSTCVTLDSGTLYADTGYIDNLSMTYSINLVDSDSLGIFRGIKFGYSNDIEVSYDGSVTDDFIINFAAPGGPGDLIAIADNGTYKHIITKDGKIGINTSVKPTTELLVNGNGRVTGVLTATTFVGALTGTATSIKGGAGGSIPYQSAADTTTFLANGSSGQILQSNGGTSAPSWVNAAPAGAITGLTIRDEGTIVGGANSVSQLNFVGNIVSVASTAGIATITFLDYVSNSGVSTSVIGGIASVTQLSVSGVSTFSNNVSVGSGITMYAATGIISATAFYGNGQNLTDLILARIQGINVQNEGENIVGLSSFTTFNFVGDYVNATGIGSTATITFSAPGFATVAGIATYAVTAGVSTSVIGGIGSLTQLQVTGISTFTNGPVFIGAATSTGTASQRLQVTGGAYVSGSVAIGTTNPTSALDVLGDAKVSGVVTATDFNSASDAKLKTNIQPIEDPIEKVIQIQGVSFNWIKDNKPSMGVIADELQKVFPELVSDTDPKTVNYNGLIGLLIEVVKEQQTRIESLENRISKFE